MAYIRVDQQMTVFDGQPVTFKSPADCSVIEGLRIYYPGADGNETSSTFALADAHGNNVGSIDLFAANVIVKVILDTESGMAFVQNADTNAYLENKFTQVSKAASAAQNTANSAQNTASAAQSTANGKASTATYSASIDTAWTANSAGGFYKTVTVSGILASDNPIADVVLGSDVAANALYLEAWALVTRITTAANSITLYANGDAPTVAFTIQLKAVR